jgi:HlyD family secretion protein
MEGLSPEDLSIAEAQVRQAEVALEQAQLALEGTEISAPSGGVVTAVNIKVGELAAGTPAFEMTDLSRFYLDVNVDEIDIGTLDIGQEASIRLDALPDVEIGGRVTSIAPTANLTTGVISYRVRIDIDQTDAPLRAGMSATANIVTASAEGVLVVLNRLIQLDRENDKAYVERVEDGMTLRVEIQIGMRNEQQSEVVAGLAEGDVLAVRQASSLEMLRQTFGQAQ